MRNKYLFVLGSYFPNPSANGICIDAIIRELERRGDDIYVLCEDVQQLGKYKINSKNVKIYFIKTRTTNRVITKQSQISTVIRNFVIISHYLSWPITSWGVERRYKYEIERICKKNKILDVICVINPVETIWAANSIGIKNKQINFYYYFLDAFFEGKKPRWLTRKNYRKKLLKFAEKSFPTAKKLIFMKNHIIPENIMSSFNDKISILDIPLITSDNTIGYENVSKKIPEKINFVYVGNFIDGLRSPENMLYFFEKLQEKNVDFKLDIYGNLTIREIEKKYYNLLQSGKLKINGKVPHKEAVKHIQEADIVVNVGSLNTSFVPSKIFEYFSMKKPVLNFSAEDSDPSNDYFMNYGFSYTIVKKEIPVNFVEDVYNLIDNTPELNKLDIERLFINNTPTKFIEEVLKGENNDYE